MGKLIPYRGYMILSLCFAIVFGGYVLYDRWPRPEPIRIVQPTPVPTATTSPIQVHVAGAVRRPGVYALSPFSRLVEAVEAAGGLSENAAEDTINLAERLTDGQRVYIPWRGTAPPPSPTSLPAPQGSPAVDQSKGPLVNINTASAAELDALPGIGPVYAERIIAYRQAHGPFAEIAQITQVDGIGPALYERIKDRITVR